MQAQHKAIAYQFKSTQIYTVIEDGQPWFLAKDVAVALGYTNVRKALIDHVDKDDVTKRYIIDNLGRQQKANYINESGVYALIFGSSKPQAKEFKRWVTSEVLPAIRKQGEYVPQRRLTSRRTKYHYPQTMLAQPFFTNSFGRWSLNPTSLTDDDFVSPLMSLLNQLRNDGHDIEGAFEEALAYRKALKRVTSTMDAMQETLIRSAHGALISGTIPIK